MNLSRQQIALAGAGKGDNISFTRQSTVALSSAQYINENQHFWKPYIVGDYIYYAAGTTGIIVFKITNGTLAYHATIRLYDPLGSLSSYSARGITHIGDTLFVCAWKFTNLAVSIIEGYIAAYDISNPSTFDSDVPNNNSAFWISTYEGVPQDATTPAWLQDPVTDGSYIYVAAQYDGLYVIDPDIAGSSANMSEHGAVFTGGAVWPNPIWEASNIAMSRDKQYVVLSNHGAGGDAVKIVDISNPAIPVLTVSVDQYVAPNGDPLRVRSVDIYGDYLYCSTNSDGSFLNSEYRGLLILDISDPTTVASNGSGWINTPIPAVDQDNSYTAGDTGDSACVGVYKYGYFAFISNGEKGIAVYNVKDPINPVYVGLLNSTMPEFMSLYHARPFYHDGSSYIVYGSAPAETGENIHTVILDKIIVS